MKYKREDIYKKTLEYFKGDGLATDVWINKYALKDSEGNIYELTPDDMHRRIAKEISRIENNYSNPLSEEEIYDTLKNFKYIIPAGSPMAGIGNNHQISSLSNCFVLGYPYDSYGSILKIDEQQVQLMKRRGGVGTDLSHLRPYSAPVKNSALTSSGLVSFMDRYSNSTKEVAQDGRRGALMLSCSIKHIDAERFMDVKMTEGKITGANISLKIDDDFMKAAIENKKYKQQYPIDIKNPKIIKEIDAKQLFDKIIHNAWKSAEPGVLFWDTIVRESIPDCYSEFGFKTTSTNPCLAGCGYIKLSSGEELTLKQLYKRWQDKDNRDTIKVLCHDFINDKDLYINPLDILLTKHKAKTTKIVLDCTPTATKTNKEIIGTAEHEVYVLSDEDHFMLGCKPKGYLPINMIKKNYILKTPYGTYPEVIDIIEDYSEEDVYDIKMPSSYHNFYYNGYLVHNCGEVPLCPFDSCRLLALNLYSYVDNPFTINAKFNFDLFSKHLIIAQRMMDDIIDLELEKIDSILNKIENDPEPEHIKKVEKELWLNIKEMALKGRRMGIGITSEGDMLAAIGLRYGTTDATDFSENIHKFLAINVYKSSCKLAKERGSFGVFNPELEKNNPFIKRLCEADEELAKLLKEGRRNIALLTVAPTGSVSLCTQTTSGIEPAFRAVYKRKRKINPNDKNSKIDIIDENGDTWEEYIVFHHKFETWLEVNGYNSTEIKNKSFDEINEIVKKSPYYKATADDVDWVEKVKLQGKVQKWVDHSISVTVNLPEQVKEELVAEVYKTAWESGCKGITVYREGSRSGVLSSLKDKKKDKDKVEQIIRENNAPKRPEKLECDILRFNNQKEKWIGFVGLLNGTPYEVFTGLLENFQVPTYVEKGFIRRIKNKDMKSSRYDLIYIDKDGYEQEMKGLSRAFNREYWNTGKLISGILRHGMPLPNVINVIDTLDLGGDSVVSWKAGIKRMLKKYIDDSVPITEKEGGDICPNCGEKLIRQDACKKCMNCDYSGCS